MHDDAQGMFATLLLLALVGRALPALPFSMVLGVVCFVLVQFALLPGIEAIAEASVLF